MARPQSSQSQQPDSEALVADAIRRLRAGEELDADELLITAAHAIKLGGDQQKLRYLEQVILMWSLVAPEQAPESDNPLDSMLAMGQPAPIPGSGSQPGNRPRRNK